MTATAKLNSLYDEMDAYHIKPLWKAEANLMPRYPQPHAVSWI